jgi:hypothetical protein
VDGETPIQRRMKLCCTCKKEKNVSLFYKNKSTKDGFYKQCIDCVKNYYKSNKSLINQKNNLYYFLNKEKHLEKSKIYRNANKERLSLLKKEYYRKNKEMFYEKSRQRHKRIALATPKCLGENDKRVITGIYNLARIYGWITGSVWHVDHIVPLKNKNVCGLHVPCNLEPVPYLYNLSKNNKHL